jgi:hypothetical protein
LAITQFLVKIFSKIVITNMESPDKVEMGAINGRFHYAQEELSSVQPAGTANFGIGQFSFLVHKCPP